MTSEISQMSDSSIVIIQGTVGLYTVATRCHTCFAVTLKYTEDSSLTILRHSLVLLSFLMAPNQHKNFKFDAIALPRLLHKCKNFPQDRNE